MDSDDKNNVWLAVIAIVILIVVLVVQSFTNCSHGHHTGVCGREYRLGKNGIQTCTCTYDHY